jgi:tetratricopeptide (TPR) repeat protein
MHPLLHDLFAAQAEEAEAGELRAPLAEALVPWLAEISDVLEARSRERQQRCLPLLEGLAHGPAERWTGAVVAWTHLARGRLLSGLGAYGPAEEALQRALGLLRESTAGPGKAALEAGCRVTLAGIARERGQLQEAEGQCRQALAGLEAVEAREAEGADPGSALALERAEALNGLGLALLTQDQPEAEEPLRQALELRLQQLDGGDRLVQISRTNLAMSLRRLGRAPEAEALYQQVLTTLEDDTCEVAVTARNNLSFLAEDAGDLERAYALRQEAVALAALALGEEHPNRGVMLLNLGVVAEQLGHLAEAEGHYHQASRLTTAAWGPDHPLSRQAQETLEAFVTGADMAAAPPSDAAQT